MKIGQVAARSGVSVDAVRFYERRGVLAPPDRLPSGYRVYTDEAVERIRLTKSLQRLGMTLDEVIDALEVADRGESSCVDERWRLETVLGRIDQKMGELERMRGTVESALEACSSGECELVTASGPTGVDA